MFLKLVRRLFKGVNLYLSLGPVTFSNIHTLQHGHSANRPDNGARKGRLALYYQSADFVVLSRNDDKVKQRKLDTEKMLKEDEVVLSQVFGHQ